MSRDRSRFRRRIGRHDERRVSSSVGKIRGDATRRVIIVRQPGVVCCRVYRFNRVGREKHPPYVGTITKGRKEWEPPGCPGSASFFSRVPRRQKMWNTNFPPLQPPCAARPPATRGRCRAEQWWSFIVSLVSSKRMTCSSAMYSDTATLTLKYHIWRIMIRGTRGVRKNRLMNHHGGEGSTGSKFGGRRCSRSLPISVSKFSHWERSRIEDTDIIEKSS